MATRVGILAFHGDVEEHFNSLLKAAERTGIKIEIVPIRTKEALRDLAGLIIPGGESTTLQKLCEREGMWGEMKKVKNIFGTCAGAILLSKKIHNKKVGQKSLGLMDIEVDRNAYGRQDESFEAEVETD